MDPNYKKILAQKRRWRVRSRVKGTAERPRLSVHFSNKHIYAQCIDDSRGITIISASSLGFEKGKGGSFVLANIGGAKALGGHFAKKARDAGILRIVFDRGSRCYHGCVQAFADATREAGLEF